MWLLLSLIAAVFYAALWVLARASKGLKASTVTWVQFSLGPPLLLYTISDIPPLPVAAPLFWVWLLHMIVLTPVAVFALTWAGQRTEVGLIKPLSGLSAFAALLTSAMFFAVEIPPLAVIAILIVVLGGFVTYHGRFHRWKDLPPWIALAVVLFFGANAAVITAFLKIYPEPLFGSAVFMTSAFAVNLLISFFEPASSHPHRPKYTVLLLLGFIVSAAIQDVTTIFAFSYAPASYVLSVKRVSILLASLFGYFIFHERDIGMRQLIAGSLLIISGVGFLAYIH